MLLFLQILFLDSSHKPNFHFNFDNPFRISLLADGI